MSEVVYPFWIGLSALERAGADASRIYLDYLADALVAAVDGLDETETDHWRGWFRRNADELGMAAGLPAEVDFAEEIRSVLSPDNEAAKAWARACIEAGVAHGADMEDPGSVISRLSWAATTRLARSGLLKVGSNDDLVSGTDAITIKSTGQRSNRTS
ncbi:hypothetical protein [Novosphingobium aerophilum]|uniref:Uncharacterized protein n=1 Tax=Novosphingobium aerophilum TaxID=2839843 RepID=A0A7X1FAY8_9SPHN|nr:hypothetical protein [Novosphingobium aerophilum]MBC2653611.1 hypothetical protein [Novosphingobium aerophilum]